MFITDISIRRPVVAWVMSLILIVFGIFVFWKLPVRELPSGIQPPVVQIKVDYKSASAPIINQEVTQVIEDVIGGAEGIKNIDSVSENGKHVPKALHVRKSPVKDLNGVFQLQTELCNGHPLWKKKHDNKFIRFFNSTEDCNPFKFFFSLDSKMPPPFEKNVFFML